MTYNEVLTSARGALEGVCAVYPVCDGKACRGRIPGVGGKGLKFARGLKVYFQFILPILILILVWQGLR